MPAAVMPIWRFQFTDNNGDPLASGTVETYESGGSSVALATYSDTDLTVTNGTTITLNSAGFPQVSGVEVAIYLLPQAYRFVLKNSAGTTLRTVDNIYAVQTASSVNLDISTAVAGEALAANDLCYLSDGSNSLTAGRWYKADADFFYASIHPVLGFATAAVASGGTGTIRIGGTMTGLSGLAAGSTYYVSATAAALTATAPTNARSVGVAISATVLKIEWGPQWLGNSDPLSICDGRLTLTTAVPVTTADVTGATTMYFTPYVGNRIALFDGSKWKVYPFTEVSLALGTLTSGLPYDVFIYDNAGTVTLQFTAWTNGTTRATALVTQNGVLSLTGSLTRRYLGTFYTTSTTQTENSFAKRLLWNYYHRGPLPMRASDATASWAYTTATFRQANAGAGNQLEFVIGVSEVPVTAHLVVIATNDGTAALVRGGIGLDSTSALATGNLSPAVSLTTANKYVLVTATYHGFPGIGRHILVWLEYGSASGTTTWYGTDAGNNLAGIAGVLEG